MDSRALKARLCRAIVFVLFAITAVSAFGALGGDVSSIDSDQAHLKAQRRITQTAKYSIHEMQAESGTVVREFVSPQGKVFALSWQGQSRPDMQQLLGAYYDEYAKSLPTRRLHHPVAIQGSGFVVESGGHQRALTGRAYVPDMIPQGVTLQEIK